MSQPSYIQPLSRPARWGVLASVILFHAGIGWALASVHPKPLTVGEVASMEVRMVSAEQPRPPEPPVQLDVPPPEDTPPPEVPQLESMIQPPLPDLPPPEFPVQAPPPKPTPPKPQPPKPQPPKPHPQQAAPAPAPPAAPAAAQSGPKVVPFSQVRCVPPNAIYPARARRSGQQGTALIRFVVDAAGRPGQVTVAQSSGHAMLDEAAASAVRAISCQPYMENGMPREILVTQSFDFHLE
jgi:protein TonB